MRTIIIYEAPHHLRGTLSELKEALGDRQMAVCRELTKKFEEVMRMSLPEAVSYYERTEPKGEYVLVIEGRSKQQAEKERADDFLKMDINEHMSMYEKQGMDRKEAMKAVAADRGVSKRDIYSMLLKESE